MAILKLSRDDEKKEIEFELDYLLSLTTAQRFEMMFRRSRQVRDMALRNGRRKTPKIIKRA